MKSIIMGDTHGRDSWRVVIRDNPDADEVVFLGDYFDSRDRHSSGGLEVDNFNNIIGLVEREPHKRFVFLLGNHDYHYLSDANEKYSGFQRGYQYAISNALYKQMSRLQMAYSSQGFLFTHAGVTKMWCKQNMIPYSNAEDEGMGYEAEMLADSINKTFTYNPTAFRFRGTDPYGDDITQSPIWVRPMSLMAHSMPFKQVVGHTSMGKINPEGIENQFWFIDCLGTSGEYLIIEDGITKAGKI